MLTSINVMWRIVGQMLMQMALFLFDSPGGLHPLFQGSLAVDNQFFPETEPGVPTSLAWCFSRSHRRC